jgi:hypothetical protein
MPQAANITVKKADGTTDIVYTTIGPAAGDGSPAIWRSNSVGTAVAHRPELRLTAREGASGAERKLRATYVYPMIAANTATGITSVVQKATMTCEWIMSKNMTAADVSEAVAQYANLLASALIKACVNDGVSAT